MDFEETKNYLMQSVNYKFSCQVMKDVFFNNLVDIYKIHGNVSETKKLVLTALLILQRSFRLPITDEYLDMPIHFIGAPDALGVVIEVPNATHECECNFVGLVQAKEGKKFYYTSEYYADLDKFSLCMFTAERHIVLGRQIQTLQDFIDAII